MRQNFKGNKRRKEDLRKRRQEEKRNKRLNRNAQALPTGPCADVLPEGPSASSSAAD